MNRAEEDIPWAIIIAIAPIKPHVEVVITPLNSNPICPIEE